MRTGSLILSLSLVACSVSLTTPGETEIGCDTDADCPNGSCGARGVCVGPEPTLELGAVERGSRSVVIEVTAVAREGDVTIISFLDGGDTSLAIEASPSVLAPGQPTRVSFAIAEALGNAAYQDGLVLRLSGRNTHGEGPQAVTPPFAVGNDPPLLEAVAVPPAAGGPVEIGLRVSDSSNDRVTLTSLTVVSTNDAVEQPVDLSSAFVDPASLTWVADGSEQLVVWASATSTLPPGEVVLRAEVTDALESGETGLASNLLESAPFLLDNRPQVLLGPVTPMRGSRDVNQVRIPFSVSDPNGELIDLVLRFAVGPSPAPGDWVIAALDETSAPSTDLDGTGTVGALVWDAATNAEAGGPLAWVASTVAYVPGGIHLELTATDASGRSRRAELAGVELGDDAPELELVEPGGWTQNNVAFDYFVRDSSADLVSVQAEFDVGDAMWRKAALGAGTDTDLPSDAAGRGRANVFVWDSAARPDANPNTPQGIGRSSVANVAFRMRACDAPDDGTPLCGAWDQVSVPEVRNQTPPLVTELEVLRPPGFGGSGPIPVSFVLADAEGDLSDIRVELSSDFGATWQPLPELPSFASAGYYDLPPGVRHVVFADPSGLLNAKVQDARLRVVATDGYPEGAPATTSASVILGLPLADLGAEPLDLFQPATFSNSLNSAWLTHMVAADYIEDGVVDVVAWGGDPPSGPSAPTRTARIGRGSLGAGGAISFADEAHPTVDIDLLPSFVLAPGDLDHDAHQDAIVVDGTARLMFGDGLGNFSYVTLTAGGRVAVGDLDGDTWLDLVSYGVDTSVHIFLANPSFATRAELFATETPFDIGVVAADVAIADVDGDGWVDLVTARAEDVRIFFGLGGGAFASDPLVRADLGGANVVLGDTDGDSRPDVVVADGTAIFALNTIDAAGADLFGPVHSSSATVGGSMVLADLDRDGFADVLFPSSPVRFAPSRGRMGGFFSTSDIDPGFRFLSATAADFNGDGLIDLVGFEGPNLPVMIPGQAPRTFAASRLETRVSALPGASARGTLTHDLDGDGDLDFFAIGATAPMVGLTSSVGGVPDMRPPEVLQISTTAGVYGLPAAADFNRDGVLDIAYGQGDNSTPSSVAVELHLGLSPQGRTAIAYGDVEYYDLSGTHKSVDVAAGDFDGDGWLDLVARSTFENFGPHTLDVFFNGAGAVGPVLGNRVTLPTGFAGDDRGDRQRVRDMDGDGCDDIVLAAGQKTSVILSECDRSFADPIILGWPASTSFVGLAVCDVDGDGILDIVAGSAVHFGGGDNGRSDRTWAAGVAFDPPWDTYNIALTDSYICGDFDGRGGTELVSVRLVDALGYKGWKVLTGSGLRTAPFSRMLSLGVAHGSEYSASVVDVNLDGLLDGVSVDSYRPAAWLFPASTGAEQLSDRLHALPGSAPLDDSLDRFGLERTHTFMAWRTFERGLRPASTPAPCAGITNSDDWRPLSDTWRAWGDVRRLRVPGLASAGGNRLIVANRLGPASSSTDVVRAGLDVGAADLASQRGIVLDLPLIGATAGLATDSSVVRVQIRPTDAWRRAAQVSGDPALAPGPDMLPRLADGAGGYRDWIEPSGEVLEICRDPDGDLLTGSGRRFVLDAGRIRVWTDRLGEVQAFVAPTGLATLLSSAGGLRLWLDAADPDTITMDASNNVSLFADKSGSGHHATQATPAAMPKWVPNAQNGRAVLSFDGVDDFLSSSVDIDAAAMPAATIVTVYRWSKVLGETPRRDALWGNDNGGWDRFALLASNASNCSAGCVSNGSNATALPSLGNDDVWQVFVHEMQAALPSGSAAYFGPAAPVLVYSESAAAGGDTTLDIARIGSSAHHYSKVSIGEMLVFDRILQDSERRALFAYLRAKWALD